jgi:dolichol kinase
VRFSFILQVGTSVDYNPMAPTAAVDTDPDTIITLSNALAIAFLMSLVILLQVLVSRQPQLLLTDRYHVRRRLQHALSGLLCVFLFSQLAPLQPPLGNTIATAGATGGWLFLLIGHRLRLAWPAVNARLMALFGPLLREHERDHLPGAFWLLFSYSVVMYCRRSYPIAVLAMLYLAVGDPVAGLVGTRWGGERRICLAFWRHCGSNANKKNTNKNKNNSKNNNNTNYQPCPLCHGSKTWAGSGAMLLSSAAVTLLAGFAWGWWPCCYGSSSGSGSGSGSGSISRDDMRSLHGSQLYSSSSTNNSSIYNSSGNNNNNSSIYSSSGSNFYTSSAGARGM